MTLRHEGSQPGHLSENDAIRRALATPAFVEQILQGSFAQLVKDDEGIVTNVQFGDPDTEGENL